MRMNNRMKLHTSLFVLAAMAFCVARANADVRAQDWSLAPVGLNSNPVQTGVHRTGIDTFVRSCPGNPARPCEWKIKGLPHDVVTGPAFDDLAAKHGVRRAVQMSLADLAKAGRSYTAMISMPDRRVRFFELSSQPQAGEVAR